MKTCCLCKEVVLEIPGCDVFLDSVFLADDDADRQVIAEGCFGDAHLSCLSESNWRTVWTDRQLSNLQKIRKLPTLQVVDDVFVSRNDRTGECCLIRNGGIQWIPTEAILQLGPGEYDLELKAEVTWDLEPFAKLKQVLLRTLRNGRTYPLKDAMEALLSPRDCSKYMSISDGLLKPFSDDSESTFESLEEGVFDGEIEYKYRLDALCVRVLRELTAQKVR
jgi:hypothetical protein